MCHIVVASEPNESRPLYRWRVSGPRLFATGIALTQEEAWRQARLAARRTGGGESAGFAASMSAADGPIAYD